MSGLSALLFAAAALSPADSAAIDGVVSGIYAHYTSEDFSDAAWEYPVFSRETAALIAHWQRVLPEVEPDGLNDFDWFCECQDWEASKFKAQIVSHRLLPTGVAEVEVELDLGWEETRRARLLFIREDKGWRLDDMVSGSFPDGLKQQIRRTIAEDEAL